MSSLEGCSFVRNLVVSLHLGGGGGGGGAGGIARMGARQ